MNVGTRLADLRQAYPECRTILFADLSSGLTLAADAEARPPQEHLDALCSAARKAFAGAEAAEGDVGGDGPVLDIVAADARHLILMARSEAHPDDAMICECRHGIDLDGLMRGVRAQLSEIADAG